MRGQKSTIGPPSDTSARRRDRELETEASEAPLENLEGEQTSNKSGKHSTVEKLAASRSEFSPRPSAGPVSGAFDGDEPQPSGTGQFRCNACGRYFDLESDLRSHEVECRAAKEATSEGDRELQKEDEFEHAPNDKGR